MDFHPEFGPDFPVYRVEDFIQVSVTIYGYLMFLPPNVDHLNLVFFITFLKKYIPVNYSPRHEKPRPCRKPLVLQ